MNEKIEIKLRSAPTLKFEADGVLHSYSWDKANPKALGSMLRELIRLNCFQHGSDETKLVIQKELAAISNYPLELVKDDDGLTNW